GTAPWLQWSSWKRQSHGSSPLVEDQGEPWQSLHKVCPDPASGPGKDQYSRCATAAVKAQSRHLFVSESSCGTRHCHAVPNLLFWTALPHPGGLVRQLLVQSLTPNVQSHMRALYRSV